MRRRACVYQQTNQNIAPVIKNFQNNGQVKNDHRSKFSNLSNWKEEAWKKKSGLQRDSNPWPPRCRCGSLPTELWSHTLGARSIYYWVHISHEEWNDVHKEIIDLSIKLDGRPLSGENTIFSKYSVPYFKISLLYFATTVLHLRKKNRETKSTVKLG